MTKLLLLSIRSFRFNVRDVLGLFIFVKVFLYFFVPRTCVEEPVFIIDTLPFVSADTIRLSRCVFKNSITSPIFSSSRILRNLLDVQSSKPKYSLKILIVLLLFLGYTSCLMSRFRYHNTNVLSK
jgi:hypothetical protein